MMIHNETKILFEDLMDDIDAVSSVDTEEIIDEESFWTTEPFDYGKYDALIQFEIWKYEETSSPMPQEDALVYASEVVEFLSTSPLVIEFSKIHMAGHGFSGNRISGHPHIEHRNEIILSVGVNFGKATWKKALEFLLSVQNVLVNRNYWYKTHQLEVLFRIWDKERLPFIYKYNNSVTKQLNDAIRYVNHDYNECMKKVF